MFGSVGIQEIILIFIIVLLLFGPKKIPEITKSVGKVIREFKKASQEVKNTIEEEIEKEEKDEIYGDDGKPKAG